MFLPVIYVIILKKKKKGFLSKYQLQRYLVVSLCTDCLNGPMAFLLYRYE